MEVLVKDFRNYENTNKGIFEGDGFYNIPILKPLHLKSFTNCKFIGFNYASTSKNQREELGIHFYLEDYQFIRLWNNIDYYVPLLSKFKYVMSPDFSLYADFPKALQIYNHYRKHWLGGYLQTNGIKIIPTISWAQKDSFEWCFDGEPTQSVVSVSSVGSQQNERSKELFLRGYEEMLKKLKPEAVIFYGNVPKECSGNHIIPIESFQNRFRNKQLRND